MRHVLYRPAVTAAVADVMSGVLYGAVVSAAVVGTTVFVRSNSWSSSGCRLVQLHRIEHWVILQSTYQSRVSSRCLSSVVGCLSIWLSVSSFPCLSVQPSVSLSVTRCSVYHPVHCSACHLHCLCLSLALSLPGCEPGTWPHCGQCRGHSSQHLSVVEQAPMRCSLKHPSRIQYRPQAPAMPRLASGKPQGICVNRNWSIMVNRAKLPNVESAPETRTWRGRYEDSC